MQLSLLRAFLVIIEEGSLTRAAARLYQGQSSLTRQLAALEHEVGARLFERTARGVALTAAGKTLAKSLSAPLEQIEDAIRQTRRMDRGERPELRIGYLYSLARSHLNPALAALRAAHPLLKVKLVDLCTGGQIRALRAGEIDVALLGQESAMLFRDFYSRKIQSVAVVAAMPEDHPLAVRAALRLADLRNALFIGKDEVESPGYNQWIAQMCRRAGFRPRFVQNAESASQMLSLAVSEGAVALMPEIVADRLAPSVTTRPLGDATARWDFMVVWQRGRLAAPVKAFIGGLSSDVTSRPAALKSA